ncbi:hypothetical protein EKN56_02630 [Limnobaculum zhutongyuii]|uniref:Uncharacterized protein n=1 Tax=Limnobaculum zhutongyuii TaxID=2498113 RepID=A0A411WGM8_9GAMM|nr:hypothetical protein [Limnobaculum zhutongyuii]QBH95395.1 hypothetical protein EKN56_02630 [Limnobaculum zhutongyuii]TQS88987.1 hypothetical protein ELQ32_07270 [Limnobaculum zhutongyuii]
MYWQEKIHRLKQQYPAPQFNDPFWRGKNIIATIAQTFFHFSQEDIYSHKLDATKIKNRELIKTCPTKTLYQEEIVKLPENVNYWLLLMNPPMGAECQIYDCQKNALRELLYLSSGASEPQFYIIDKKYQWLVFFNVNRQQDVVTLYKSGQQPTIWG